MKHIIIYLLCFGIGCFVGARFIAQTHQEADHSEPTSTEMLAGELSKQKELIGDLQERLNDREALTEMLNKELAETRERLATKLEPAEVEEIEVAEAEAPFVSNMQLMAVEMMEVKNREEIEKLQRTLNLNPEQLEALEAFYQEESAQQSRIMERMFSGQPMDDIQDELMDELDDREYHVVSDLLEDILTPEQLVTYEENEEKEALEQKEALAYSQLSLIQRQFVLDEDQKDAVFAIYYEAEYELESEDFQTLGLDTNDPDFSIQYVEAQNERLLDALSEVLTEEQIEIQRKKLETDLEMQRKAMSMFGEGFSVSPRE